MQYNLSERGEKQYYYCSFVIARAFVLLLVEHVKQAGQVAVLT